MEKLEFDIFDQLVLEYWYVLRQFGVMLGDGCSEFDIFGGRELPYFEDILIFGSFVCEFYFEMF